MSEELSRETLERKLAATYTDGHHDDPWKIVESYREYLDYHVDNPDEGSSATANKLEQPRGRIRTWMDGSKPFPVQVIEVADANGWLTWEPDTRTTQALNCLVAWVFAGGSIREQNRVPYFTVNKDGEQGCIRTLLTEVTDSKIVVNERGDRRATEITIDEDSSFLGRTLEALGAPVGVKNEGRADLTLPDYLDGAPKHLRTDWARTYVWLRGSVREDRPEKPVQIQSERPKSFINEVHDLLNGLGEDIVRGKSQTYRLSPAATTTLHRPPTLCCGD